MTIFQAAILGLVQGLAEFLPISSSGHLLLTRMIMGISDAAADTGVYIMLDILLHTGTLLAVMVVFWKDWWEIIKNPFKSKQLLLLFIASLPALIAVIVADNFIDRFFTGWFLGGSFLITALLLFIAEKGRKNVNSMDHPGYKHAIAMGIMQVIALLPGVSRSGATITGGILSGLNRKASAKFAFMMSAPAIVGSLLFEAKDAIELGYYAQLEWLPTLVGMAVAAVSGYLAIRFMLRLINRVSLKWFALYAAVLGTIILALQIIGFTGLPVLELPRI